MIGTYCPTCGCQTIRWMGCDDLWHILDIEHMSDKLVPDIDVPGTACDGPGTGQEPVGGPRHE